MKHLSLKARLTLLYTSMMILLFAFIIGLLFSVGSQAILTNTRALLEEQVSSSFDSVSYRNNRLEFDSDLPGRSNRAFISLFTTSRVNCCMESFPIIFNITYLLTTGI